MTNQEAIDVLQNSELDCLSCMSQEVYDANHVAIIALKKQMEIDESLRKVLEQFADDYDIEDLYDHDIDHYIAKFHKYADGR